MRLLAAGSPALVAFLCASCGGGGGYSGPSQPSPPAGPPAAATISIVGERGAQSFTPNPATVVQGTTVAWRNTDTVVHRIVANDGSLDTGNIAPGATSGALALATNGANYHCSLHPTMIGAINGSSGAPPPCEGPYC